MRRADKCGPFKNLDMLVSITLHESLESNKARREIPRPDFQSTPLMFIVPLLLYAVYHRPTIFENETASGSRKLYYLRTKPSARCVKSKNPRNDSKASNYSSSYYICIRTIGIQTCNSAYNIVMKQGFSFPRARYNRTKTMLEY